MRSGANAFINAGSLKGRVLESYQDGQDDYATVYTGRRHGDQLPYTFNATSGHLYLGDTYNVLSYQIPSFRSNSVQLATLSEGFLAANPTSWSPLQCTVSASILSCTASSKATRYRPANNYSVFVAVPRAGQSAADIYLYTQSGLDGRPLGASQVNLQLSVAY